MKIRVRVYKHESRNSYSTTIKYFAKAKLIGKRIVIDGDNSNLTEKQMKYYEPPLSYTYRAIDKKVEVFNKDVNFELNGLFHFYVKLNYLQRFRLKAIFGNLWIQQTENFKWVITAIMAGIGSFLALANFVLNCNC